MASWATSYMTSMLAETTETQLRAAGLEEALGACLRGIRLRGNVDQATLAARAGVSLGALKHLEGGKGATVKTLALVARALGREGWLTGGWASPGEGASGQVVSVGVAGRRRAHRTPARGLKPMARIRS